MKHYSENRTSFTQGSRTPFSEMVFVDILDLMTRFCARCCSADKPSITLLAEVIHCIGCFSELQPHIWTLLKQSNLIGSSQGVLESSSLSRVRHTGESSTGRCTCIRDVFLLIVIDPASIEFIRLVTKCFNEATKSLCSSKYSPYDDDAINMLTQMVGSVWDDILPAFESWRYHRISEVLEIQSALLDFLLGLTSEASPLHAYLIKRDGKGSLYRLGHLQAQLVHSLLHDPAATRVRWLLNIVRFAVKAKDNRKQFRLAEKALQIMEKLLVVQSSMQTRASSFQNLILESVQEKSHLNMIVDFIGIPWLKRGKNEGFNVTSIG